MTQNLNDAPLGKSSPYIDTYTPELLFPIAREGKRLEIGVEGKLPFHGVDIWNAYELSWLNKKGKPEVALGAFHVPCESPNLIESKSFKLYLNSFNQTRFDSVQQMREFLQKDLSKTTGAAVTVELFLPNTFPCTSLGSFSGESIDDIDLEITEYEVDSSLLQATEKITKERLYSNLLKSNCLVTGQPDWASVEVYYEGPQIIREGLLAYLISFRKHLEFHEQCIERIFMDIMSRCRPKALSVYGRFTRRGGLDINPYRAFGIDDKPVNTRLARQ